MKFQTGLVVINLVGRAIGPVLFSSIYDARRHGTTKGPSLWGHGRPPQAASEGVRPPSSMVRVAVLVGPRLATTGSSGFIGRLEATLGTREKRHGASDPSDDLWPWRQAVPTPRHLRSV